MSRAILVMIVLAGACKKAAPTGEVTRGSESDVQDVSLALQVVAVSPAQIPVQTPIRVRVYGGGFEEGAAVDIGAVSATSVVRADANSLQVELPSLDAGEFDVTVTHPNGKSSTLRRGLSVGAPGVASDCRNTLIFFELNQAGLSTAAKDVLLRQAPCISGSSAPIDVEGHADERGTTDYNVALGQRRARSVLTYLQSLGVSASRAKLVSWGEERPSDAGHTEESWAKNRRVEVRLP
jgi:outer membrane protein OmpA-like peptidoglycan-associated protein